MNEANLVPSLLQAIVNIDGDALVMHAGDKPYVVAPTGQVELASRGLTLEAVNGIVMQLLPIEFQQALDEFGAIQYSLTVKDEFPNERFTVVVARGGDDVWAEIRRRRVPDDDLVPMELFGTPAPPPESPFSSPSAASRSFNIDEAELEKPLSPFVGPTVLKYESAPPETGHRWPAAAELGANAEPIEAIASEPPAPVETAPLAAAPELAQPVVLPAPKPPPRAAIGDERVQPAVVEEQPDVRVPGAVLSLSSPPAAPPSRLTPPEVAPPAAVAPPPAAPSVAPPTALPAPVASTLDDSPVAPPPSIEARAPIETAPPVEPAVVASSAVRGAAPSPVVPEAATISEPPQAKSTPVAPEAPAAVPPVGASPKHEEPAAPRLAPPPGVVLPMSRGAVRFEPPPAVGGGDTFAGLERLLRTAAARGASTLYLSSDARPSVRVDGDLQSLDTEPVHTSADVISLLLSLMPDRSHEALRTGATTEWICDIEDIGRVRCMSFSDHRGPGGVFRLMPVRTVSADQLGLSREVQSLALEPEGLVLITGSRSSGKRALISSLVDLINRTRRDHVITIEREVNIVHTRGSSFISQREVRGTDDDVLAAARAALREDPDVLVLDQIRTGLLMNVALEAAASGHLVIGGFSAHNATESIDRILDLYAPEYARHVQLALADNLRGVVAQVLLPKVGGGRVAAREVLLNTPAVASVISEGKTSQLPMAIEGGRRVGMVPLNDALVGYVQGAIVDIRDAYRHVTDRPAFIALLKRQGVDTSALERLA